MFVAALLRTLDSVVFDSIQRFGYSAGHHILPGGHLPLRLPVGQRTLSRNMGRWVASSHTGYLQWNLVYKYDFAEPFIGPTFVRVGASVYRFTNAKITYTK